MSIGNTDTYGNYAREGIKLSLIDKFIYSIGGRSKFVNLDIIKVCNDFVKPLTSNLKLSYCDYLKAQDSSATGEAQVFVCHIWTYKFLDLIDTLETHFHDNLDILIWLDLFSNNHHSDVRLDYEAIIEQCNHMVLMTSPWRGSVPLTKIIYSSDGYEYTFDVAMSPADQEEFSHVVEIDENRLQASASEKLIENKMSTEIMVHRHIRNSKYYQIKLFIKSICEIITSKFKYSASEYATDTKALLSLVLGLGVGFEVCAALLQLNGITMESLDDCSTEDELIAKLKQSGIHNTFHQRVLARNMLVWRSHFMARETSAETLTASSGGTLPFPKEGIKLSSWDIFINECGGRSMLEGLSTTDVNNQYQKPLTVHTKSSYCDYLKTRDCGSVGEAQVFISHAWKYVFLDVVDTLQYHFRDNPDTIIWFDLYSNNQHAAPDLDFHWWSTTFKSAIEQFNHTVLILSPWNNPIPLTRAWCLFEIYCTAACKCRFEVAMSPSDQKAFIKAILMDATESINVMLATVDTRKSESWNPADKTRIFDAVERTVGFDDINSLVFERLRDWVIDTVKDALQDCSNDEDRAYFKQSLGLLYINQGRYELAEPYLRESFTTFIEINGEKHSYTLFTMNSLALLYDSMGIYDVALPLYTKCLALQEESLGEKHPNAIATMNNLALLYNTIGKYEVALLYIIPLFIKCVTLSKEVFGEKHPNTIGYMSNLALLYDTTGRYNEALPIYLICVAISQEVLGEKHPNTLQYMHNLALLYDNIKRYDEALPLYTRCLALREEALGGQHLSTLTSMNNLAALYCKMGKYDEALPLYTKCLAICEEVLGDKHPTTLTCMNNLAALYHNKGKLNLAVPLYTKCLAIQEEVLGEKHPDTLASMNNLAAFYNDMGRCDEALRLHKKCFVTREEAFGEKHPSTLISMNNLTLLYDKMGRYGEALPLYEKYLAVKEEELGEKHPETLQFLNNLASLYFKIGRYDEALLQCTKCFSLREEVLGEKHVDTLATLNILALLYDNMGNYEEALSLYTKCVTVTEEMLGEKNPDTLKTLNTLAFMYNKMGRYDEALPLYIKCLVLREEVLGEKHPDTLLSMNNLAAVYDNMKRYDEALPLYMKCLAVREEELGEKHPDTLVSMNNLALLYDSVGRYDDALPLYTKCLAISEEVLGEKHPNTLTFKNNLLALSSKIDGKM